MFGKVGPLASSTVQGRRHKVARGAMPPSGDEQKLIENRFLKEKTLNRETLF